MKQSFFALAALAGVLAPNAAAQLSPYSQDFESLDIAAGNALEVDGWGVFANVFDTDATTFLYGYGVFPAPNGTGAFSEVATGLGGVDQGLQYINVFSDYNNPDHGLGRYIEAN
ncbi:MAG: hypothetical protein AAFP86_13265, partial [Planctomycetota bacterium]